MQTRIRLAAVLAAIAALVLPAASHADPLLVPYTLLPSAITGGVPPSGSAPGTNDWTCKPPAAHPRPVVLVHGTLGNRATNWQTYGPLLKNNGYCVFALTYGRNPAAPTPVDQFGGLMRLEDSARQLKAFVARVLAATGAHKVDLIGHSQGTLMPDYYVKYLGGATRVERYISLAPLWHGTDPAGLATLQQVGAPYGLGAGFNQLLDPFFPAGGQMMTGSAFMARIRAGGTPKVDGVDYTNIMTRYDELVRPYTSGIQAGMRNVVVQNLCAQDHAEHFEIAGDPVAARVVLNVLDPAHRKPVPCRLVLPFVGTL